MEMESIIENKNVHASMSFILGWLLMNYNIIMSWLEIDKIKGQYYANKRATHVYFYIYLTLKIYLMMVVWLSITYVLLLIFYFIVIKALGVDSNIFKNIINGNQDALLDLVKNQTSNDSNKVLDVKKITYMIFGSYLPQHFMKHHVNTLVVILTFTLVYSTVISPFSQHNESHFLKSQLKLFYLLFFIIFNITFLLTMSRR
jgi:hypothetical protein